eukprot:1283480-Amphidinium_carterae.1
MANPVETKHVARRERGYQNDSVVVMKGSDTEVPHCITVGLVCMVWPLEKLPCSCMTAHRNKAGQLPAVALKHVA